MFGILKDAQDHHVGTTKFLPRFLLGEDKKRGPWGERQVGSAKLGDIAWGPLTSVELSQITPPTFNAPLPNARVSLLIIFIGRFSASEVLILI